jgi:hypothetical protein
MDEQTRTDKLSYASETSGALGSYYRGPANNARLDSELLKLFRRQVLGSPLATISKKKRCWHAEGSESLVIFPLAEKTPSPRPVDQAQVLDPLFEVPIIATPLPSAFLVNIPTAYRFRLAAPQSGHISKRLCRLAR